MNIEEGDDANDGETHADYELAPDGVNYVLMALRPRVFRGNDGGPGEEAIDSFAPFALHGANLVNVRAAGADYNAFAAAMSSVYPNWFPPLAARWGHMLHALIVGQPGMFPAL